MHVLTDTLIPFFTEYKSIIVIVHLLSAAVGVGGATVTDLLFFKFLKDFKITKIEADTMNSISALIWIALFVLIISGIALYLPENDRLNDSAKFLTKIIAIIVLVVNGTILNVFIAPKLPLISFKDKNIQIENKHNTLRHFAFAFGAISISSWYFVFILGALRKFTLNFGEFILIYAALLFIAIVGSQIFNYRLSKKTYEIK